eukprot:2043143-Pyramimonas_sp.AAC.1
MAAPAGGVDAQSLAPPRRRGRAKGTRPTQGPASRSRPARVLGGEGASSLQGLLSGGPPGGFSSRRLPHSDRVAP